MTMRKLTDNLVQYPLGITNRLSICISSVIGPHEYLLCLRSACHVSSMYGMKRTRVAPLTEDIQDVVVDVTVRRSKIEGLDTKDLDKGIFDLR